MASITSKSIPSKLVPSRDGDLILITVPNYWGKGKTLEDAKKALKAVGGRLTGPWRVHSIHPTSYVDSINGGINHPTNHEPVVLAEHDPA